MSPERRLLLLAAFAFVGFVVACGTLLNTEDSPPAEQESSQDAGGDAPPGPDGSVGEPCGATRCGVGERCVDGACECKAGFVRCGATCVDTAIDVNHCGGCGRRCLFADAGCDGACEKLVFVTSRGVSGGFGGPTKADGVCEGLASDAGLPGTYRAWIGGGGSAPAATFVKSTRPYRLRDGRLVAASWEDLVDGKLEAAIELTEKGSPAPANNVWSGVRADGTLDMDDSRCSAWTDAGGTTSAVGSTRATDASWTELPASGASCNLLLPVYCFEQ